MKVPVPTDGNELRLTAYAPASLGDIARLDAGLVQYFNGKMVEDRSLSRSAVSFQANKTRPFYRWYKYKEAFSASLVENLLERHGLSQGTVLDPFAGMGTTLFSARALGLDAHGIELLPVGQAIIAARLTLETTFCSQDLDRLVHWQETCPWRSTRVAEPLNVLRITQGASGGYAGGTRIVRGRNEGRKRPGAVCSSLGLAVRLRINQFHPEGRPVPALGLPIRSEAG